MTVALYLPNSNRFFGFGRTMIPLIPVLFLVAFGRASASDYSGYEAIHPVITAAEKAGVDPVWAETLIGNAKRQQSILEAIARPAEKTKPWHHYREIFITDRRIREGVGFWDEHAVALSKVSERTGVPVEIIVAIIGVETFYGQIMGSYRVIDALSTLAFDYPKRSAFFTKELQQFLILAWESGKDPYQLKGSYAGAMGYGQFMPSSYRAYALSIDGIGAADIWDNPEDAISSVGNYLRAQGGARTSGGGVDNDVDPSRFRHSKPIKHRSVSLRACVPETLMPHMVVTPIELDEQTGPRYWLGLQNFYVITRQCSTMYAMAVWELSRRFVGTVQNERAEGKSLPTVAAVLRYFFAELLPFSRKF